MTKMIMAIVQDEDANKLLEALAHRDLRATRIGSTGGFLRSGNSTILIGVDEAELRTALGVIAATCVPRQRTVKAEQEAAPAAQSQRVVVGGATVFVWDIEQYIKV